ncbi:hypothetical protein Patl1_15547 [Pistacia atlantica]|uniref:Uncharacterized protein n=1 Tax=Pistacia atlantica TaxID=434234 RepID=A0ACC1B6C5_9ROSI|nr:hypothetical protein Patl1_15547 [Pistacia atlantica]
MVFSIDFEIFLPSILQLRHLPSLMLILFLFTSITINLRLDFPTHPFAVPVTFAARPITVRFGFFPRPLTLSLLASILLRPPLFWVVYFFIIISSPLHDMLWNALKYIFDWFVVGIRSFSTLVIIFHAQLQDPGLRVEIV